MHILLSDEGAESFLADELRRGFPQADHQIRSSGLLSTDLTLQAEAPPTLVFARQFMPEAEWHEAKSIADWSDRLFDLVQRFPEHSPWCLHLVPHYGSGKAGQNRCRLIRETLRQRLQRQQRRLLRMLQEQPMSFTPECSLVQLLLLAPDQGWVSVALAPRPFEFRRILSPFPKGEIPIASDKAAPSRAFAKLIEAELRLGRRIASSETCVDLGASPGSWSYVALQRGARVTAVDRAPLRADLMHDPGLTFRKGDAFNFEPNAPVDWLLCDVIAAPDRSIELLIDWARRRLTRRFVVTIKFKGRDDYALLERLKHAMSRLCEEFFLTRLCANKNEACAFGVVKAGDQALIPSEPVSGRGAQEIHLNIEPTP
jgi:23S rRNA (cytidine2498-2'-O)-methyltransferase